MTTLVKKEIRLLLPAFVAALALAVFSARISPFGAWSYGATQMFFIGIMLLGASSFGREVSLKTFSLLLAQPVERVRVWRVKMWLLAAAVAVTLFLWRVVLLRSPNHSRDLEEEAFYPLVCVVLAAGAVCLTLFLRQFMAAFWLSFLLPVGIGTAVHLFGGGDAALAIALGLYGIAAFLLARWQFLRAQDTAWTGGIVFVGLGRLSVTRAVARARRPWLALLKKELQLSQATLLAMAALLALNLAATALWRYGKHHDFRVNTLETLAFVGVLWFVPPVMWGCQCVTEERKMGTLESLLCLPVSRTAQWGLKLALTIASALASLLFYSTVKMGIPQYAWHDHPVLIAYSFIALGLAGFYASTLTREIPQALGLAVAVFAGAAFGGLAFVNALHMSPGGEWLLLCLFYPAMIVAALWLSWGNIAGVPESWALWRRNLLMLTAAAALALGIISAIHERAWELLTPTEPPQAPSRLPQTPPPKLLANAGSLAIVFPDGTLWSDSLVFLPQRSALAQSLFGGIWQSAGANTFAPGTNWTEAVPGPRETVALRSDGSLWIRRSTLSASPIVPRQNGPWTQCGNDTDWKEVALRYWGGVFLLKQNGTLWGWNPGAALSQNLSTPIRLGTNSDWTRLMNVGLEAYAWRRDGTAWKFNAPGASIGMPDRRVEQVWVPEYLFRQSHCQSLVWGQLGPGMIALRDDGTLWSWFPAPGPRPISSGVTPRATQIGSHSDWASVASAGGLIIACKTDGTLWRLDGTYSFTWAAGPQVQWVITQMGSHNNWLGVSEVQGLLIALSADGSLWHWAGPSHPWVIQPKTAHLDLFPLRPSRKPQFVENIFDKKRRVFSMPGL